MYFSLYILNDITKIRILDSILSTYLKNVSFLTNVSKFRQDLLRLSFDIFVVISTYLSCQLFA